MTAEPGKASSGVDLDQPALNRLVDVLRQQLHGAGGATRTAEDGAPKLLVAFSGGPDSTALLLAAVALSRREAPAGARWAVRAAHVNHQLQPQAELWQRHCAAVAEHLEVDLSTLRVAVQHAGTGLEAAAREARYRALAAELLPDEWLLTAHHAEDQLETVLFRLARGTGPDGLAGVPLRRRFGEGQLVRPFLALPRLQLIQAVVTVVDASSVLAPPGYVTDPSNVEQRYARSYLRTTVVPTLEDRWPAVAVTVSRAATLQREQNELLAQLLEEKLRELIDAEGSLNWAALQSLSTAAQAACLRAWLRGFGVRAPTQAHLSALLVMLQAGSDRNPKWRHGAHVVARWRGRLWLLAAAPSPPKPDVLLVPGLPAADAGIKVAAVQIATGAGALRFASAGTEHAPGSSRWWSEFMVGPGERFAVARRRGGESVRYRGRTVKLKHLLQEHGVEPWWRDRLPLVYRLPARPGEPMDAAVTLHNAELVLVPGILPEIATPVATSGASWRITATFEPTPLGPTFDWQRLAH